MGCTSSQPQSAAVMTQVRPASSWLLMYSLAMLSEASMNLDCKDMSQKVHLSRALSFPHSHDRDNVVISAKRSMQII